MSTIGTILHIALLVICAEAAEARPGMKTYSNGDFSLVVPKETRVTKKTPAEDFDLFEFRYKNQTLLSGYVGNHPSFPSDPDIFKGVKEEKSNRTGYTIRSLKKDSASGRWSREVLLDFSGQRDWPEVIHLWYSDLSAEMARIADDAMLSALIAETEGMRSHASRGAGARGSIWSKGRMLLTGRRKPLA